MSDKYTVKALISIGRAEKLVDKLLDNPLFDDLSKHNRYWDSEHEKEADLLHDIRCQLMSINEGLSEIAGELHIEYDVEDIVECKFNGCRGCL